jgi:hypothetical protein
MKEVGCNIICKINLQQFLKIQMKTKKHKESKVLRWNLTHSAGCIDKDCATHWVKDLQKFKEFAADIALTKPVSVPRSLRFLLGRYIVGENSK